MKKRKKIVFSIYNYFEPICAETVKLQTQFKAIAGSVAVSTYITANEKYTLLVTIGLFIINELLSCISFEEDAQ